MLLYSEARNSHLNVTIRHDDKRQSHRLTHDSAPNQNCHSIRQSTLFYFLFKTFFKISVG